MISDKKMFLSSATLSGLSLVIIFYLLLFNMMNIWPHNFHSDAAASIVINNEARHENSLIPQDWYYINGDLFHYGLLTAPFVGKETFSFSSHLAGEFLGLSILLVSSIYFSIVFFKAIQARLIFIAFVFCGLSFQNARFIFFEQAYILNLSLMLLACSFAYSFLTSHKIEDRQPIKITLFGLVIAFLVLLNPMRTITTAVPLMLAVAIDGLTRKFSRQHIEIFLIFALSFFVGWLLYFLFSFNKTIIYSAAAVEFIGFAEVPYKILSYFVNFFTYLELYPFKGKGLLATISAISLILFLVFGLWSFLQYKFLNKTSLQKNENSLASSPVAFLARLCIISFLITVFSLVFLKNLLVNASSIRYQITSIILLFAWLISIYQFEIERYNRFIGNFFWIFISGILVIVAFNVYMPPDLDYYKRVPSKKLVAQLLEANNIQIAYGSYWNASVTTVFSGAKTHALPIDIMPVISQKKWLSSDRLWRNNSLFNKSALILTKSEYDYLNAISGDFGQVFPGLKDVTQINEYYIAFYTQNLAKYLLIPEESPVISKISGEFYIENCQDCIINVAADSKLEISIKFYNSTKDVVLSSLASKPYKVGVSLLDDVGGILDADFSRILFYRNLFPNESIVMKASINMPTKPGKYYMRFAVVKEGVKWYVNEDGPTKLLALYVN